MTLDEGARTVNDTVGMPRIGWSTGMRDEVLDLAARVGMTQQDVQNRPKTVAREITAYLDDIARNP